MTEALRGDAVLSELLSRLEVAVLGSPALSLTGLLLPAPQTRVRLAVSKKVFEFEVTDVTAIAPRDGNGAPAGTVVIELRPGAKLHGVFDVSSYRELLRGRRPFALSVRLNQPPPAKMGRYLAAERDFLVRRGLLDAS